MFVLTTYPIRNLSGQLLIMKIYIHLLYWYVRVEYIIYKTYFYQVIRINMIQNNGSRRTGDWIIDLKMISK